MTFSLVARDMRTGSFGMVVSSSSPAVASRCTHLRAGVGVVASQNVTNPALGQIILNALAAGVNPEKALADALKVDTYPDYRQLSVINSQGELAHHSGGESLGINHQVAGAGAIAAGNLLASHKTIDELLRGYAESAASAFEQRLLDGLSAALAAGGEAGPVRSAGLEVVEDVAWATTNLRVDDAEAPISELQRLWALWEPQKIAYRTRAVDPTQAPSYGVPGDE